MATNKSGGATVSVSPDPAFVRGLKARQRPHADDNYCVARVSAGDDEDLRYVYANALRRTLIEECPYVSFGPEGSGDTTFEMNTSNFNDEFVCTRIALLPLNLPKGLVRQTADGGFEWLGEGRPRFRLTGSNKVSSVRSMTGECCEHVSGAKGLLSRVARDGGGVLVGAGYDRVGRAFPTVAKLAKDQKIITGLGAAVATGRDNACFSPIGTVAYRIGAGAVHLVVEANNDREPTAEQHVYDALYWARQHLLRFARKLGDEAGLRTEVLAAMDPPGVAVSVPDETETRASVLTAEVRHRHMGGESATMTMAFAAHRVPHPLETVVEWRLQPKARVDDPRAWGVAALRRAADDAAARYARMLREWAAATKTTGGPTIRAHGDADADGAAP